MNDDTKYIAWLCDEINSLRTALKTIRDLTLLDAARQCDDVAYEPGRVAHGLAAALECKHRILAMLARAGE